MRLKNLKKETAVAIRNKNEYFFLMDLLEKAGYKWTSGVSATAHNNKISFYNGNDDILVNPLNKCISFNIRRTNIKPIKSIIKFEIGDRVKFNSFVMGSVDGIGIISEIKMMYGTKRYLFHDFQYVCSKKFIEPFFEDKGKEKPDEVDWSKVEVDTPILVRNSENVEWLKRHFAKFEGDNVYTWECGTTSWTAVSDKNMTSWKYAKLANTGE